MDTSTRRRAIRHHPARHAHALVHTTSARDATAGPILSTREAAFLLTASPKNRRVSRYRYNAIPMDQPGRYIYIRDMESGKFWSPTWQPTPGVKLGSYECRHGAGYTRIASRYNGMAATLFYFVPPAAKDEACPCELWVLKIKNTGKKARKLRSFSYIEFSYCDALGRPAQSRLVPAHLGGSGEGRDSSHRRPVLRRPPTSSALASSRPASTRIGKPCRPLAGSVESEVVERGQAQQRGSPSGQQHRLALPQHHFGTPDKRRKSSSSWA